MSAVFDNEGYIKRQREALLSAINKFDGKVYLELGGKLLDDHHASRVLPGFSPDTKMRIISGLDAELFLCISSENIQAGRIRSDYNTLYTEDCVRLIETYQERGLTVSGVILTVFDFQPKALKFEDELRKMGVNVYHFHKVKNYPNDIDATIESFAKNDFIETTKPLVIMTSSGSASGKLSACLSQVYNEYARKKRMVGYVKYDIFPVWNLGIDHPLNLAFEAATADSKDEITIDPYYYEKYGEMASNYNRDLTVYPIIRAVFNAIYGENVYDSPTEMVINTVVQAIVDENAVNTAALAEIKRRYEVYRWQMENGFIDDAPLKRMEQIMKKAGIT